MNNQTPPNDAEAERSAIHHALNLGKIPEPLQTLKPSDFYQPKHETIWQTIQWLTKKDRPCDANAVLARLQETKQTNTITELPNLLNGPLAGDPHNLALILTDRAGRRYLAQTALRLHQQAHESEQPYEEILRKTEAELANTPIQETDNLENFLTLDEFLAKETPETNWVIPELMARGERLILTGVEGLGKSTLIRQIALCAAAGMQPFTGHHAPPVNVLLIDVENPEELIRKRLTELRRAISAHGYIIGEGRLRLESRPQGLNLAEPADRRWLQKRIILQNPDLIVIGPAYKLHDAGNEDKDETIARTVTNILDHLRGNAALVLEHHSGNEQHTMQRPIRPFGSSLWRRWPEFGYGIRPAKTPKDLTETEAQNMRLADLIAWRGARDVRSWPKQIQSGGERMPWITAEPNLRSVS